MLGNHVNVSARNKKLLHKVLCAFLAVVLLGLMIPHGITASLNAYAGDADNADQGIEQTTDNANEEVNSEDSDPADPVFNDAESNADVRIEIHAGEGGGVVSNDPSAGGVPRWYNLEQIPGTNFYNGYYGTVSEDEQTTLTYGAILDEVRTDLKSKVELTPDGTTMATFEYEGDIDLETFATAPATIKAIYVTNVYINNTTSGHNDAKLVMIVAEAAFEMQWGAPISVKYGSTFEISTEEEAGFLWLELYSSQDAFDKLVFVVGGDSTWKGFRTDTYQDFKIVANHTFTATYDDPVVSMPFYCVDPSGGTIEGAKLMEGETEVEPPVDIPEGSYFVWNDSENRLEFWNAETGGDLLKYYTYQFEDTYRLNQWEYREVEGGEAIYLEVDKAQRKLVDSTVIAFRATYKKVVTVDFNAYLENTTTAIDNVTLKLSTDEDHEVWQPAADPLTFDANTYVSYDSENGVLIINDTTDTTWYKFFFDPSIDPDKYSPIGWYNVVGTTHSPIWWTSAHPRQLSEFGADELDFASEYIKNSAITFSIDLPDSGAQVMHSTDGSTWSVFTGTKYYGEGYSYRKLVNEINKITYLQIGTVWDETFTPVDWFCVDTEEDTGYQFGKWAVGTTDVTTDPADIGDDVAFSAKMQIALTFKILPDDLAAAVGQVEVKETAKIVTQAWAYPNEDIIYGEGDTKDQITIGGTVYQAVSNTPVYVFGSWQVIAGGKVPDTPQNFTVTFKKQTDVEFNIAVKEGFEGQIMVEYGTGSPSEVLPNTHMYFAEGSNYWSDGQGGLIIGKSKEETATQYRFFINLAQHTHFNAWNVDDEAVVSTNPIPLTNEIPHTAVAEIDVDAQVIFDIESPEGATADNCVIKLNGTAITPGTKYFYETTAFTVDGKSLNITTDVFYADSDEHFQVFSQWKDEVGEPLSSGTLEYNQSYTFKAKFVKLNPLTAKGTCEDSSKQTKLDAAGYVDVYFIDKTTHDKGNFYKSYPITSTAAAGFTLEDELPHNVHLYVNASAEGWISKDAEADMYNVSIIDNPITLLFKTDGALQFDKDGVSADEKTWTGTYGKKFDMYSITKNYFGVDVNINSTMTTTIKNGDKINLVDFSDYSPWVEPPTITATLTYQNDVGDTITKNATFQRQAFFDLTDTTDIDGSTTATITFSDHKSFTNIDVHNAARNVIFTKDTTSKDGKFVNQEGAEVSQIAVSTGYKFNRATTGDNKDKVVIKAPNGTVMFTISPKGSEVTDHESIFRAWTDTLTSNEDVVIVEDVTFIGKFVDKYLNVHFEVDTTGKTDANVTGPGIGEGITVPVYNDSIFDPFDTSRIQKTGNTVKASFVLDQTHKHEYTLTMDPDKAVDYKFADLAFTTPELEEGQVTIKVNETMLNNQNILVVKYKVVDKEKCTLTANLDGGALAPGYSFESVPENIGGHGEWTPESDGTYTNTFFEETTRTVIDGYMLHDKMSILRTEGFFSGNWSYTGSTSDWITADEEWKAIYDDSALVTGKVETSKPTATPEAAADVIVELSNPEMEIAPGVNSVKGTTDANGTYTLKVYGYAKHSAYVTGKMTAGSQKYIEKDTQLDATDWNGSTATKNFTGDIALDQGLSFFAVDYTSRGPWYARYYEQETTNPHIGTKNVLLPVDGEVVLDDDSGQFLSMLAANYISHDSGNEIIVSTSTPGSSLNVKTRVALSDGGYEVKEDVEISSNKLVYTVWGTGSNMTFSKTVGKNSIKISRIDYRIPWEENISIHGKVTDVNTKEALDGINVTYTSQPTSNELVLSKTTFGGGYYYLIIPQYAAGKVMFVDPWTDTTKDDHLDERIRLTSGDTKDDITGTVSSGDKANPEMIPAIHVEGNVQQVVSPEGVIPPVYGPAEGANVSYSQLRDPGPDYDDEWNDYNHGYAVTDSHGDYVLKLAKTDDEGGFVWFYLDDDHAQDGHKLMKDGVLLPHNEDIDDIDGRIDYLGSYVQIDADGWKDDDHDAIHHFEIITYYDGEEIDRYESDELIDTKGMFSDQGRFRTGYDEDGEHVLEYYVGDPDDFRISVKPIISEGYTYWSWKLTDAYTGDITTLDDLSDISLKAENTNPYIFTVYATDSAVLVANGTSEGHVMWDVDVTVISADLDPVTENIQVPAGTDFVREFPLCKHEEANEVTEEIHTEYYFDGENFNLVVSSEFEDGPYEEHWVLDPVAAEGYYLVGLSMNNIDMVVGDETELLDNDDLNLVAHYAPIPEEVEVNAQTGDNNMMLLLAGLAIVAMIGVAYTVIRKKKGAHC